MDSSDLASQAPSAGQTRFACAALLFFIAAFLILFPFIRVALAPAVGFIALYGSALVVTDLFTGLLLLGQFPARRSRGLALLAFGYLFSSLTTLGFVALFPGLLAPALSSGNSGLAAWLYLSGHAIFPLFVIAYARAGPAPAPPYFVHVGLGLVLLLAMACLISGTLLLPHLPPLITGQTFTAAYHFGIWAALGVGLVALAVLLLKRPRMLLDMWIGVALVACVLDVLLSSALNTQRFDLGFYAGRVYGLVASLFILAILTAENLGMHIRLAATFTEMLEARARQKSLDLLATVFEQLPEGIVVVDREGRYVLANETAASLAGTDLASARAHTGDLEAVRSLVGDQASRASEGEAFRDELIESAAGGNRRILSVSGVPVRDLKGEVAAAVVMFGDVTERDAADKRLRDDLARSNALLENTPLAGIEWGGDMIIRRWTSRAEELFGWRADDIVGRRMDDMPLIHPDDLETVAGVLTGLINGRQSFRRSTNRNLTRDGRVLHCEWYNSALRGPDGRVDTVFSLALDITEQRQIMEQLHDADRRKDVFIATLAHELRNPLAPISNAASLMIAQKQAPERVEWLASMISRQSARMARLLDDLLDVSRISRGKVELRKERVDLANLVRDALHISMPLIEAGRHHLEVALPLDAVWVEVDALRMSQVVSNLVNNAAKYTQRGGQIRVALFTHEGTAELSVADNGIGIDHEMLAHVFEPFVQVARARDMAQGGLGIGLALTRGFVELHHGTIDVASAGKDRGSVFTVTLPLAAPPSATRDEQASDGAATHLDASILVADDNEDAAESLAQLLRARGAKVVVAHDGVEALQLFQAHPAQVAILDLGMPRLGGLQVATELRSVSPRPYLVALTGRGRKEDRIDSIEAGFDEHLTKPVPPAQLITLIAQATAEARE